MSTKVQIGLEVRNTKPPIVHSVAKQNVMCLAKDKVLTGVNQSVDDLELELMKEVPKINPALTVVSQSSKFDTE